MLRFVSGHSTACTPLSRREWLRIGAATGLGWWLPLRLGTPSGHAAAAAPGSRPPGFGRARSVILIYASGGQSQLDMWDPKPDAPREIRGEFEAIGTSVPGTLVSEHMPRLARLADRYTIVRNVSHDDLDHGSATYLALTGQFHPRKSSNPPPQPTDYPTYGSILTRVRPTQRFPYTAVHLNAPALVPTQPAPGQFGGFLGREFEPMILGDVTAEQIPLPGLDPVPELPQVRLSARQSLLEAIDDCRRELEANSPMLELETIYRQAFELLADPRCRQAFDLSAEPPSVRDRYGRYRPGQACLLARRLVEAGVPWITVVWSHSNRGQDQFPDDIEAYGWDTHNDIFFALRERLLPRFDFTFSALLEDLDQRGLLDHTLVVCMGEFGRAPLVAYEAKFAGRSPGRKHWANVYSIAMAGAGIGRGQLYGASDRIGARPETAPVGPPDIAATMFSALGVDPASHYLDPTGRPLAISTGRPIAGLYGSA
jgi:hypothetical protein